ncbi:MAG: PAS domain S-box protein [Arenimonas sp.]
MDEQGEEDLLRSVALQNAQSILAARQRAEEALLEAQSELRESREMLRSALGASGAGAFRWQPDADLFVLGENLRAMLGQPLSVTRTTLGTVAGVFDPDHRARFLECFRSAARDGSITSEFSLPGAGGVTRWLEVRGRIVCADGSVESWLVGTMTEITQRKLDEAALREGNEMLRATFQQATVAIAIASLDGRFEQVNDKFVQVLGYDRAQLADMTFMQITHPDDVTGTRQNVKQLLGGEIADYQMEKRYLRSDGAVVWSHTAVSLLRDESGQARRFIGAINDITERKAAEQALAEQTRVLETLNHTNAVLASQLQLDVLLQQVTDSATQLSGARFGAFFYNSVDEQGDAMLLYVLSGAPRSAFADFGHPRPTPIFAPTLQGEGAIRSDDILADPRYGQWAPHHGMPPGHLPVRSYLAVPVRSRSGQVLGGLFFGHPDTAVFTEGAERIVVGIAAQAAIAIDNARLYDDVRRAAADRELLLEAERAARTQAERAGLLKDEFLATLSHELRTPLNAVLGWSQILVNQPGDAELQRRGADTIARNARLQAKLIDDLLDMNRIVSGKVRIEVQPTWLEGIIDAALDAVRPPAEAKGITLTKVVDAGAGPVSGDPTRLQQVIWNLLSNSVKFTGRRGRIGLHLARVESHVELSVTDNGIGIAPDFLPFVFDRFRQADSSTTRVSGGLGLGLAIVKQLVELHGGQVDAFSEGEDRGSTFRVRLPLAPLLAPMGSGSVASQSIVAAPSDIDLAGVNVLVVDDEADASALVSVALELCGARCTTASGADDALDRLKSGGFDLLISDIGMPQKDGYELIRELRADRTSPARAIPAVALTAFARSEDRTRAMLAGYQVHLAKPVDPRELVATVGSLLGRFESR